MFCATVHYSKDEVKKHQHYVLCSNDLGHDKDSIYFYNKYIIDDLKEKEIAVKNVHYWSDEPSSQFKNQFHKPVSWAGSSSKSWLEFLCDCPWKRWKWWCRWWRKNVIWCKTLQQKEVVTSCEEFRSVAKKKFPDFAIAFLDL